MVRRHLFKELLAMAFIIFTANTCFAQEYYYPAPYNYNYNNGYYNQQYQYPVYENQYNAYNGYTPNNYGYQAVYDPSYQTPYQQPYYYNTGGMNEGTKAKLKKALTYGAIGAGAGYLFSKDGRKMQNTAIGAGIGAAMSLLLK
ncbi:MAG: hypothetical protein AB1782_17835 [Cyanobacteriota bacterium]